MHVPLTISGLPELQSLSDDQRRRLLVSCQAPGPLRLWMFNLSRGLFLAAILFLLLHANDSAQRLAGAIGAVVFLGSTAGMALLMHVWTITRIRGQVRMAIEAASSGGLVPICLQCGHDCSGSTADRCTECGASRRVDGLDPGAPA